MQKLFNDYPPLMHKFSNPVKVRLTPEGEALAARLYAMAVTAGDVEALPGFDAAETIAAAVRTATPAADAEDGQDGAGKASPKGKAKAPKTAKAAGVEAPADVATGCAQTGRMPVAAALDRGVCATETRPGGRSVAKSMGAKLDATAKQTKKRRRAPMDLEDLLDSPKGACSYSDLSAATYFAAPNSATLLCLPSRSQKNESSACSPRQHGNLFHCCVQ